MSPPVSSIKGQSVVTVMVYGTASFDISESRDPDLSLNNRFGLTFHMFCMPETSMKVILLVVYYLLYHCM